MDHWSIRDWESFFSIVAMVGAWVAALVVLWLSTKFATKREVAAAAEAVEEIDKRLIQMEARVSALPDAKTMHELALSMSQLGGEIKVLAERLAATREQLDRIDNILERHEDIMAQAARASR